MQCLGGAKVRQLDVTIFVDQHVARLDVAVDDVVVMQVLQAQQDLCNVRFAIVGIRQRGDAQWSALCKIRACFCDCKFVQAFSKEGKHSVLKYASSSSIVLLRYIYWVKHSYTLSDKVLEVCINIYTPLEV